MDVEQLRKFDLIFPGHLIDGEDRALAFQTAHILYLVESQFCRAVVSYAMFKPVTADQIKEYLEQTPSSYERSLNNIYAEAFVFSLNTIRMLLRKLKETLNPPDNARRLISEFETQFKNLEYIRDSAMHIEDRGRGVDKYQRSITSALLVLGGINGKRFGFTGHNGNLYEIEISQDTLINAHGIIQSLIDSYDWRRAG
jgi:hypothetical protein